MRELHLCPCHSDDPRVNHVEPHSGRWATVRSGRVVGHVDEPIRDHTVTPVLPGIRQGASVARNPTGDELHTKKRHTQNLIMTVKIYRVSRHGLSTKLTNQKSRLVR